MEVRAVSRGMLYVGILASVVDIVASVVVVQISKQIQFGKCEHVYGHSKTIKRWHITIFEP